jgi:hypothetical protein
MSEHPFGNSGGSPAERRATHALESFTTEGTHVTPLAPSEVRRLGDRMRRRRNAAGVIAGVAAMAVIATPVALLANRGSGDSDPQPAPPGPTQTTEEARPVLTEIPDGFPLLVGVENDPEGSEPTISPDEEGLESLALCAREVWPAASVDRLAAEDPALDFHYHRELLLFPSDAEAKAALAEVRDGLADCASETTTDGAIPDTEFELVHTAYEEDTGAAGTVTWTDAYADGSISTQVFQFVRVGNAVAGTQVSSEADRSGVVGQVPMVTDGSTQLAEAMQVFAGGVSEEPDTRHTEVIPDDFPLASGWPDDSEAETEKMGLTGPNRTLELPDLTLCDTTFEDPAYLDQLRAQWTGPEVFRGRTLTVFADADQAVAHVDALTDFYRDCPTGPARSDNTVPHHEVRETSVGGQSVALVTYSTTTDGGDAMGGDVRHVVRVGRAVYIETVSSHGSADIDADIEGLTTEGSEVVAEMCLFTEAGCSDGRRIDAGTGGSPTFGPDDVLGGDLRIGMSLPDAEANGAEVLGERDAECVYVSRQTGSGLVNGYVRRGYGVSTMFTEEAGIKTPEGVGARSELSAWRAAYPEGTWDEDANTFTAMAPGRTDREYQFSPATDYAPRLMLSDPEHHCDG